jgi:hypothetical protein
VRPALALLPVACCLTALTCPAKAQTPTPRYQLLGDWSFHGHHYRFVSRAGAVEGRSLSSIRVGRCLERAGTELFRGYRFRGSHGGADYWRGRLTVVGAHCRRILIPSTISQPSDLSFSESSRLPGGRRPPPSTFTRVRPPLSATDPVLGTWVRNGAGVVVAREGPLYVGRAREVFSIANGCTVGAGTVVWRLRPIAPDRYSGTIQTFFGPPGCAPASLEKSTWVLEAAGTQLVRQSSQGLAFPYTRA